MAIDKSPFARKLESLAREKRVSFRELSRRIEMSPALITRVLKGDLMPSENLVQKIAVYFELSKEQYENLIFLAEISQTKIVIEPRSIEQAQRAVAFKRALEKEEMS